MALIALREASFGYLLRSLSRSGRLGAEYPEAPPSGTKPVRRSELRAAIDAALRGTSLTRQDRPTVPLITRHTLREARSGSKMRVLLAEDNLVNQRLAVRITEKRGHTLVVANNGKEALAALAQQAFDLLLMDAQMPEMEGFEATAEIREEEKATGRHLPIVAMTAHAMKGDKARCLAAGMDAYISKPINAATLYALLDKHFRPSVIGLSPHRSPEHPEAPPSDRPLGAECQGGNSTVEGSS